MKRFFKVFALTVTLISIIISGALGSLIIYARRNIDYDVDEELFRSAKDDKTVYYYAYNINNELIEVYKSSSNNVREWTNFEDCGKYIKLGFIAMEDRDYYNHKGINVKRTVAAVINHFLKFRNSFGASTITQQVIKNISGDNENNVWRKVKEILRAINLERNHSKDDIFELYLNIVPMTGKIYGVGAASEIYFDKEPDELTIAEAATIVGITNAPSKYNPYSNPDGCIEKRNKVLFAMREVGYITLEEYEVALQTNLELSDENGRFGISSWFIETANNDILKNICDLEGVSYAAARLMLNGAKVLLTMSPEIQNILEDYFSNEDNLSENFKNGLKYSMVVSDPCSGDLLGIIGNAGKKSGELLFNYATAPIIPGSVLKPLALYAPLIESGDAHWSTIFDDSPVEYKIVADEEIGYPKNSPDVYDGDITLCEAIKKSKNTVAIRAFQILGADRIFNHLKDNYGFTLIKSDKNHKGETVSDIGAAALALGQLSYGESLRKLTEAYGTFANDGILSSGRSYTKVYNSGGEVLLEKDREGKRLYSPETTQIMNQLLYEVVADGTARQIKLKELIDVAGKTGTSGNDRDRLFVGYTPYYTAGIWCGYGGSDIPVGANKPNHLEIWDNVMTLIHDKLIFSNYDEVLNSFNTDKIMIAPYCSKSGEIPTEMCELDDESEIKLGYYKRNNSLNNICEFH